MSETQKLESKSVAGTFVGKIFDSSPAIYIYQYSYIYTHTHVQHGGHHDSQTRDGIHLCFSLSGFGDSPLSAEWWVIHLIEADTIVVSCLAHSSLSISIASNMVLCQYRPLRVGTYAETRAERPYLKCYTTVADGSG